jgi:integrase
MPKRRSRGDGGLHWDESRQRWIATASLGFDPAGKRVIKRGSGRTKTEAKTKLKEVLRDYEDGLAIAPGDYTVSDAVTEWLAYGLNGVGEETKTTNRILCATHIVPLLGSRKLRDLSADDVDKWLAGRAKVQSTNSLRKLHSALNRSIRRAMARDKVKRNVVGLCSVPTGREGRPSKALTFAQAEAVLSAAEESEMRAYIVVSLLTGARTEEMRALTWDHVDLAGQPESKPPRPAYMAVWRSVRADGDTKTRKSRRTLALPKRCVEALTAHKELQAKAKEKAGKRWVEQGLVFTTRYGTPLDSANVRRNFRAAIEEAPGVEAKQWTPRELRHSFVSLLSDQGVLIEEISRLVGHKNTSTTEMIYRKQIRPVIETGATAMDAIFGVPGDSHADSHSAGEEPGDDEGQGLDEQGKQGGPKRT